MRSLVLFLAAGALLVIAVTVLAVRISAAPALPGCTTANDRQFDFWVGDWNVYDPTGKQLQGTNTVTLDLGRCVVHEHWKGTDGSVGESFNFYYPETKKWHQTWVSNAGYLLLDGGMVGKSMVLTGSRTGRTGRHVIDRISYTPDVGGSVRQIWDLSIDGGKTWKNTFDGKYVKKQ